MYIYYMYKNMCVCVTCALYCIVILHHVVFSSFNSSKHFKDASLHLFNLVFT